jgi:hypothetical protein
MAHYSYNGLGLMPGGINIPEDVKKTPKGLPPNVAAIYQKLLACLVNPAAPGCNVILAQFAGAIQSCLVNPSGPFCKPIMDAAAVIVGLCQQHPKVGACPAVLTQAAAILHPTDKVDEEEESKEPKKKVKKIDLLLVPEIRREVLQLSNDQLSKIKKVQKVYTTLYPGLQKRLTNFYAEHKNAETDERKKYFAKESFKVVLAIHRARDKARYAIQEILTDQQRNIVKEICGAGETYKGHKIVCYWPPTVPAEQPAALTQKMPDVARSHFVFDTKPVEEEPALLFTLAFFETSPEAVAKRNIPLSDFVAVCKDTKGKQFSVTHQHVEGKFYVCDSPEGFLVWYKGLAFEPVGSLIHFILVHVDEGNKQYPKTAPPKKDPATVAREAAKKACLGHKGNYEFASPDTDPTCGLPGGEAFYRKTKWQPALKTLLKPIPPDPQPPECADGEIMTAAGKCIKKCGSDEIRNAMGKCIKKCGPGEIRNMLGVCVKKVPPKPSCKQGEIYKNGKCLPRVIKCSSGYTLVNGVCKKPLVTPPVTKKKTNITLIAGAAIGVYLLSKFL